MNIYIIAGALGSGKTNLISGLVPHLIDAGITVGIIENEAGNIPIDSIYLKGKGYTVFELYAGCICCSISSELTTALEKMTDETAPDVILIEPSGIAAPDIIRKTIAPVVSADCIIKTVMLNDVRRYRKIEKISPFFRKCFETADLIISNKTGPEDSEPDYYPAGIPVLNWQYNDPPPVTAVLSSLEEYQTSQELHHDSGIVPKVGIISVRGEWDMINSPPPTEQAENFLNELRKSFVRTEGTATGHMKLHFPGKEGGGIISLTDDINSPERRGVLKLNKGKNYFNLNILLYNIDETVMNKILKEHIEYSKLCIKLN